MYYVNCNYLGIPIIVLFEVEPVNVNVTVNAMNVINEDGMLLQSISNITNLGANRFAAGFMPPLVTFSFQVSGTDENGYNFLRTSDTSVTVTAINLMISKCVNDINDTNHIIDYCMYVRSDIATQVIRGCNSLLKCYRMAACVWF